MEGEGERGWVLDKSGDCLSPNKQKQFGVDTCSFRTFVPSLAHFHAFFSFRKIGRKELCEGDGGRGSGIRAATLIIFTQSRESNLVFVTCFLAAILSTLCRISLYATVVIGFRPYPPPGGKVLRSDWFAGNLGFCFTIVITATANKLYELFIPFDKQHKTK